MNKWDAKFGFFWYNDDEIFNFSKKDFEDKAKKMADSGINIVMTFSCTHFRWCMKEHWPLISNCLKNVVDACHKYDIKVVEHHSSHLTWDPLNDEDWDYMERVLNKRHSSIQSWKGIRQYVDNNTVKGTENYRQIDGRTGEWARSNYKGWCKCFNNDEYRKAYFDYLEELYKVTGIDGIMTDDVQYFGLGHACSCEYCTKLFKENYGYDMPGPGNEWKTFHGDFDNPVYIAWEKFRKDSTLHFQEDVNRHFKKLGLNLLRPNYVSGNITFNWSAYPFEKALHIWDWVFQENCFSFVIKYSWPQFLVESRHRFNMGRLKDIPSMSMFYPDRYDSFYFTWALSMAWGQMFTATPEGEDMCDVEKVFRDFEKKYSHLLFEQKKQSDITIYWSYETANFCNPDICNHITAVKSWLQALTFAGYTTDMVFASEKEIDYLTHKCLLVPDVMMMDDKEYEKINKFIENGGTVIYTGRPGVKKPNGTYRTIEEMQHALKMPSETKRVDDAIEYSLGKGKVVMYSDTSLDNDFYNPHSVDRWRDTAYKKDLPEYRVKIMADNAHNLLNPYIKRMVLHNPEREMINSYFSFDKSGKNMLVHIVNADKTMNSIDKEAGHNDIIPTFIKDADKTFSTKVIINKSDLKKAYIITVEQENEIELNVQNIDGKSIINVPDGIFSGYALIRLPLKGADMKEVELYTPVKNLLKSEGYDIRAEVAGVDISAIKDEELLIVEMKTAFNMKLLMQAVKRQRMSSNVYIAIPRPTYKKRFSKDTKDREYLLRRLSIGLIYVVLDVENPYAVIVFPPKDFNINISRGKTGKKTKRLIKEHKGRSENYNVGGSVRTKLVTAYRENSLKIAYVMKDKDSMKTRELHEAGCPDKTTTILYNNHYGWFIKVGRAEYSLSEEGVQALVKYKNIIKHIVKD